MADRRFNWFLGCAIGCGAILLVVFALVVATVFFVRDTLEGFDSAVETRETLDERFGPVESFIPWPDGAIPTERLDGFLAIRQASRPAREELVRLVSALPVSEEAARELEQESFSGRMRSVAKIGRAALGLGATLGDFFEARNAAMLDSGMGLGEYTYLYVTVYYGWLGHSPGDGPGSKVRIEGREQGTNIRVESDHRSEFGGEWSEERPRRQYLVLLRNQRDAAESATGLEAWRDTLTAEIEALEADRDRLPWQDGLPPELAGSLTPYRERLETAYEPMSNPFELLRSRKQGRFSVTAD